jgi:hypothetical protein
MIALTTWTEPARAETYVILSMVGDHITVVGQRRQSGKPLDANESEIAPINDTAFDDFAVRIADKTIAKARPDAASVTVRAGDPSWYKMRDSWLDADVSGAKDVVDAIKQKLPPLSDAHLLLITPYRDQLQLRSQSAQLGTSKVSGLGFYIDATTWFRRSDTNETSRGFLGIFANFQLVLIDLQTGALEGHERVVLGTTRSSARAEDRTPWNALTATQKTQVLESLIKEGIEGSLPKMLAAPKR